MNLNEVVTLLQIQGGAKLVAVRFQDPGQEVNDLPFSQPRKPRQEPPGNDDRRHFTYKCLTVPDIRVNDLVVVEVRGGMAVATVVGILPVTRMGDIGYEALKHVVCRLDLGSFETVREAENKACEALAMAEINDRLTSVRKFMSIDHLAGLQRTLSPAAPPAPPAHPDWTATPMPMLSEKALQDAMAAGVVDNGAS